MSEDWDAIAAEVSDALASVGFEALLQRAPRKVGDPSDPIFLEGEVQSVTVMSSNFNMKDIDGTSIQAGDKLLYVATKGLLEPPAPGDVFLISDRAYKVITCNSLEPGSIDLMYEVQVRT